MMKSVIEINNCNHYVLNESGKSSMYFTDSVFMVEQDFDLKHPFGKVYKPKGCLDTLIRFVKQPNKSVLLFRVNDWNVPKNPYFVPKIRFSLSSIIDAFYSPDIYL